MRPLLALSLLLALAGPAAAQDAGPPEPVALWSDVCADWRADSVLPLEVPGKDPLQLTVRQRVEPRKGDTSGHTGRMKDTGKVGAGVGKVGSKPAVTTVLTVAVPGTPWQPVVGGTTYRVLATRSARCHVSISVWYLPAP